MQIKDLREFDWYLVLQEVTHILNTYGEEYLSQEMDRLIAIYGVEGCHLIEKVVFKLLAARQVEEENYKKRLGLW